MLDFAEDIPHFLADESFPSDHRPEDMMSDIQNRQAQLDEVKSLMQSQIDYNSYMKPLPQGDRRFLRFQTLPKDIVLEFIYKDLEFYLEQDNKFKKQGKPTFKFAVAHKSEFEFLKRLMQQGNWEKVGALHIKQF